MLSNRYRKEIYVSHKNVICLLSLETQGKATACMYTKSGRFCLQGQS